MRNRVLSYIPLVISLLSFHCSSSKQATSIEKFEIQYYTVGGITGLSEGLTLTSDGWAKFWSGSTAALATTKDSIKIDEGRLKIIDQVLKSEALTQYEHSMKGNISTVLTLLRGGTSHTIMFSGIEPPNSAPQELKHLLNQLHNIK